MDSKIAVATLDSCQEFFDRSTSTLTADDAGFVPAADMMSVSQQIEHVARTIEWFTEGAFRPEGFDMDFEGYFHRVPADMPLDEARARLATAFDSARAVFAAKTAEDLAQPLPPGPVMGGLPRHAVIGGIEDHTAHHRGALTVYARLCGRVSPMPYMDME